MCIAILNKSAVLSRESLQNCWDSNSHGAGILYTHGQELLVYKQLRHFEDYYQNYQQLRSETSLPMLLHFRIKTSGETNELNCHPFLVPDSGWGLVHNGMLDSPTTATHSDTWHFANYYATQFRDPSHPAARHLMQDFCGSYNKLLFLHASGEFFLINEKAGHWDKAGDTWYSNDSYQDNRWSYHGAHKYERGSRLSLNVVPAPGGSGLRRYQQYDDWTAADTQLDADFRRRLDEYDDRPATITDQRRAANERAVRLDLFRVELVERTAYPATLPFGDQALEQDFQDWALVEGLAPEMRRLFETVYVARQAQPNAGHRFQTPEAEVRYQAWCRVRLDYAAAATPKKTASSGAGSSVTSNAASDWDSRDNQGRHGEDMRDNAVGCVCCGRLGLDFDPDEDAYWCMDCYTYLEADMVFEAGNHHPATATAPAGAFD